MISPADGDPACAFCTIVSGGDRSIEVICEAESWLAFFPLSPATRGHTLVIPRAHVTDIWQVDPPLAADLMVAMIRVGRAIHKALTPEGMNLITSAGEAAEQTIFHLHLHLVPRWQEDGFGSIWPAKGGYENAQLDNVADRIRAAYRGIPQ